MSDMSPYLRARHATRPAILAQRLLAREQDRAGTLAAECDELLSLTRELLVATGHARLLADDTRPQADDARVLAHDAPPLAHDAPPLAHDAPPLAHDDGEAPGTLLDAYAEAAMAWARVVGSLMALGGTLLDQGEWNEVRRLAAVLADAGEDNAAADLRTQLGKAVWDLYLDQLRRIHAQMRPAEIATSLATLRAVLHEIPEDFPDRNREVNRLLVPVASAIHALLQARAAGIPPDSRVAHIAAGGVARYPEIVAISLDELCAEFEGLHD
jgi:hypothetical protein